MSERYIKLQSSELQITRPDPDRIAFVLLSAVTIAVPVVNAGNLVKFAGLPQTVITDVAVFAIFSLWLCRKAFRKGLFFESSALYWPLFLFLAWSGLSVFWSVNSYEWFRIWSHWFSCCLLIPVLAEALGTEKRREIFACVLFVAGILVVFGGLRSVPGAGTHLDRLGNKNYSAHYIVLVLPAAFYVFYRARGIFLPLLSFTGGLVMVVYLFANMSRGALLALALQLFLLALLGMIFFSHKLRERDFSFVNSPVLKRKIFCAAVPFVFFLAILLIFSPRIFSKERVEQYRKSFVSPFHVLGQFRKEMSMGPEYTVKDSATLRLAAWRNSIEMIKDSPVRGVGLGNFKIHYPEYRRAVIHESVSGEKIRLDNLHNDFLQLLVELGVAGLLIAASLFWLFTVISFRQIRQGNSRGTALMLLFSLAGFCVVAFFSFPMAVTWPPYLLCVFAAFVVSLERRGKYICCERTGLFPALFPASAFGLTVLLAFYSSCRLISDYWLYRSKTEYELANSREDMKRAVEPALKAAFWNPWNKYVLLDLGRAFAYSGSTDKAIGALRSFLEGYPNSVRGLSLLGFALTQEKDYSAAAAIYGRALSLVPDAPDLHNLLGILYLRMGIPKKALSEFNEALAWSPKRDNPAYYLNKGDAEMRLEYFKSARASFERAAEINPYWNLPAEKLVELEDKEKQAKRDKR